MCMTVVTGMVPQDSPVREEGGGTTAPAAGCIPVPSPPAAARLPQPGEKLSCADTQEATTRTTSRVATTART